MRRLLIIIFLLVFCDHSYADGKFNDDVSIEEGMKLLAGEKNISILYQYKRSAIKDKLIDDISADIRLKLRLIGL